jgi:hypothetical protein
MHSICTARAKCADLRLILATITKTFILFHNKIYTHLGPRPNNLLQILPSSETTANAVSIFVNPEGVLQVFNRKSLSFYIDCNQ